MKVSELDERMAPRTADGNPMAWIPPSTVPLRLAGFPWHERDGIYRRLPVLPAGELPDGVESLANCCAGGQVAFRSDSGRIGVRVELAGPADMNHMPATGQCGFDLYTGSRGALRFHGVAKYDHACASYEVLLFEHPERKMREFTLNFPLYQGVNRVQIGLAPDTEIAAPSPWASAGRIVIYGTSITQGGCASRPGMAYTNILSRALNLEVVNLGFSGNGRGEPVVIGLVAAVPDPLLIVLDYEANSCGDLAKTLPVAIRILREKHPSVPIAVVSRIAFADDFTREDSLRARESSRDMQTGLVEALRRAGDPGIHFVDGSVFLGADGDECTVDGVHPNDLGFMRIAGRMENEIRAILGGTERADRRDVACDGRAHGE